MQLMIKGYRQNVGFALRWLILGAFVGLLAGAAVSIFIRLLNIVTDFRNANLWIIVFLPIAGMLSVWLYNTFSKESNAGNDLIIDEVLEFRGRIRFRMAPLILASTLLTHLFGGSAGREGSAVQMSGALAGKLAKVLKLVKQDARLIVMAGISGGFSAIFGTPVAGAIFGMEVITRGQIHFVSAIACVASALTAGLFTKTFSPVHETYHVVPFPTLDLIMIGKLLLLCIPFALTSMVFSEGTHWISKKSKEWIANGYLRIAAGAVLVLLLFLILRDPNYLGLSLLLAHRPLNGEIMPSYAFALKMLLTMVTLGFGFKGGEVTPLFVIGALLGSALAPLFGIPVTAIAAIGFVSVFAAASKTPIACTIMGVEIFGASYAAPLVLVNFICFVLSGHSGIYQSQSEADFGIGEPEED
jgi:H+/Cl- antiporter ClcA